MDGSDARTSEHGDGKLGDHRHVDRYAVTLLDAHFFQDVSELADVAVEFPVGQDATFAVFTFPDEGGFVAVLALDMAVETGLGNVELATDKPLGVGAIPFEDFVPFLAPDEFLGVGRPETFRVGVSAAVKVGLIGVSLGGKFGGRLETTLFGEQAVDGQSRIR